MRHVAAAHKDPANTDLHQPHGRRRKATTNPDSYVLDNADRHKSCLGESGENSNTLK